MPGAHGRNRGIAATTMCTASSPALQALIRMLLCCWPGRPGSGIKARLTSRTPWPARAPCAHRCEGDAADIIHALMSPEVYRLLVVDRGWNADRYQQWLADTLTSQLLRP